MNLYIFNLIHGLAGKSWLLDWTGIFLAEYLPYLMVLYALYVGFRLAGSKKRLYFFSFAALATILSRGILVPAIRTFYYSARPFLALNFEPLVSHDLESSMPSGHVAFYFALAFAVFYFNKKAGSRLLIASVLMGLARIFVGVHWPLDILAGLAVAVLSFFVVLWLLRLKKFEKLDKEPAPHEAAS